MKKRWKDITCLWLVIIILSIFNQVSVYRFIVNELNINFPEINYNSIKIIFIIIVILSTILILLFLIIIAIVMHFIGVITDNDIGKTNYLYIISFTFMINMLSVIPLGTLNLLNENKIYTLGDNLFFILINPFLLLSIYVLLKLLIKFKINTKIIILFIVLYYLIQILSQFSV